MTVFLLTLGAVARVTRFVNADYLFRGVRDWAVMRTQDNDGQLHPERDFPYLLTCPWCASIWIAGGAYTLAWFYGHTPAFTIVTAALSASYIYAVLVPLLDPPPTPVTESDS